MSVKSIKKTLFGIAGVFVFGGIVVWVGCSGDDGPRGPTNEGTFTDSRNGKTYRTMIIGTQTWMAENLNIVMGDSSWCYGDDVQYCRKYGRLYGWDVAMDACPTGWRLPSREDWDVLIRFVGESVAGEKLKSIGGNSWQDGSGVRCFNCGGSDDFGFSALPGGYRTKGGKYFDENIRGYWWSATESDSGAYNREMNSWYKTVFEYSNDKLFGISVRCLRDD